jgi:hypothetical protein
MNDRRPVPESAAILSWLSDALYVLNGKGPDLGVLRRQDNPSSTHWIIGKQARYSKELFFVKMHSSRKLYSQEKKALSTLSNYALPTEPYAVPRMLGSSDELNCIALEWIDGASIGSAIRSSVRRFSSSAKLENGLQISSRVGTWLRELKKRTVESANSLPSGEMLNRFIELVQLIETSQPRLLPKRSPVLLVDTFEQCLSASEPEENCLAHNDFWFDHIWTRGAQIIVLDFGRARIGPGGRDAIQFYCRLLDMAKFNPLVSKSYSDRIIQSFIAGYGGLDLSTSINRVWQLCTRAEQLAGLIELSGEGVRNKLKHKISTRALARQLLDTCY